MVGIGIKAGVQRNLLAKTGKLGRQRMKNAPV